MQTTMPYTLNKLEINRIAHSLGIPFYHAFMSHKKKDKTLPKEFYRNYYQCESDETLDGLVNKGYAIKQNQRGLQYYFITEKAIEIFKKEFAEIVNYKPKNKRDESYLRKRINVYCAFHNYNFGTNNAQHILEEYQHKYSKGIYVSHTTKDTIITFEPELKKWLKITT